MLITTIDFYSLTRVLHEPEKAYIHSLNHYQTNVYYKSCLTDFCGNTSSQTSAMVIQGMASGEIKLSSMLRFLRREFLMALMLGAILGLVAFGRIYYSSGNALHSFIVSFALSIIVLISVTLGSCIPFLLRRLNIDPAFSAGPVLATIMDIMGVMIFCYVARLLLV